MNSSRPNAAWHRMIPTLSTFVLVVLVAACLYWASPVLITLAAALLISFMLSPAVTWLQRRGVPRTPAVFVVIGVATLVLSVSLWNVGSQVVELIKELPVYQSNVTDRIAELRKTGDGKFLRNLQSFVQNVTAAATGSSDFRGAAANQNEPVSVTVVENGAESGAALWIRQLQPVAEHVLTAAGVLVLVIYLLIFREDLRSRSLALVGRGQLTVTTKALDDAGRRISRYLLAQFFLNFGFGIVITIGLLLLGVPHAALWGFAAGLLRYIPYLGPWMAAILPIGMSLLVSAGWTQPLSVIALFVVCELITNLVMEPWLYGQSIGVSQAALIVAVIFWTWLWGAVGLMLAAPLTTCLVVMGKYIPALRFLDVLLGDEPVLSPDVNLFQRLVARDVDEAAEIVRRELQSLTPVEVCDRVLVPAIVHARKDMQDGLLTTEEYQVVLASMQTIVDEQDWDAVTTDPAVADNVTPRPALAVLGFSGTDEASATALALFQHLLDPAKISLEIIPSQSLTSEVTEKARQRGPTAMCIVRLPGGRLAQTLHLCKRLRAGAPHLKVLICRWGAQSADEDEQDWNTCNADYVCSSFAETIHNLEVTAQFLRPDSAVEPTSSAATHDEEPAQARIDPAHAGPPADARQPTTVPLAS